MCTCLFPFILLCNFTLFPSTGAQKQGFTLLFWGVVEPSEIILYTHNSFPIAHPSALKQKSPTFLASRTGFMQTVFPWTKIGGWFQEDSRMYIIFIVLFISIIVTSTPPQITDISSQKLGTPSLKPITFHYQKISPSYDSRLWGLMLIRMVPYLIFNGQMYIFSLLDSSSYSRFMAYFYWAVKSNIRLSRQANVSQNMDMSIVKSFKRSSQMLIVLSWLVNYQDSIKELRSKLKSRYV